MELHGNTNENPVLQDPNLIRFYLQDAGFKQVFTEEQMARGPSGNFDVRTNVFTEKWVRI
jgi:hypothetical protein